MKKMTYFVMALALVLGLAQCKKEQMPDNDQTEGIRITLNVKGGPSTSSGTGNSKVVVDPLGHTDPDYATVTFEDNDVVYVGYCGTYVGSLTYAEGAFSGMVNITEAAGDEHLHFYFLGGVGFAPEIDATNNTATVKIGDQSEKYPVISCAPSDQAYTGEGAYSAKLMNKVSIMKFDVTAPSTAPICITGMNNKVTLNFDPTTADTDEGFSYSVDANDNGLIKMPARDAEGVTWAIVLPQEEMSEGNEGTAFTEDGVCVGQRPAIHSIEPNMYYHEGDDVISMAIDYTPLGAPLTFEAMVDNSRVAFSPYDKNSCHMEYSLDNGVTWVSTGGKTFTIHTGQKVMFRASSPNTTLATSSKKTNFTCDRGSCYVYGNLMSLLDKDNYTTQTELTTPYTFRQLFRGNDKIYNHPSKSLYLPATTLSDNCYQEMFRECPTLTEAPIMTVTTVGKSSCNSMFLECTNLTTAPIQLLATALDESSYEAMFMDCANLTEAPSMLITSVAKNCCYQMFRGCTSMTTAPVQLSAPTLAQFCYQEMFYNCSSLTDAPTSLNAETLASSSCYLMFAYCTSLTTAPALPGTTLANSCYNAMFRGCTSLTTAPELPATTLAQGCYAFMFQDSGLTTPPLLPATVLVSNCYNRMFQNCSNLSNITCLAESGIDENYSTVKWLENVASTGTFTKAPGVTWPSGTNGIPDGWTVEEATPETNI